MTIEYRAGGKSEIAGDERELHGLVTPFDTWTTIGSRDAGGFDERISPGAFTKTLRERDVVLIDAHDTSQPLARMSVPAGEEGHLLLSQDSSAGLRAFALPVLTTRGKDVLKLAKAKVIRGMSFGFEVIKDSWTDDDGRASDKWRGTRRTIQEVRLHEVTTTAFPAYPTTELDARDSMNRTHLLEERARFQKDMAGQRAAKATYADVYTCGECAAVSQYGDFCGECGAGMEPSDDSGAAGFCTSCGQELDGGRKAHSCEKRDASASAAPEDSPAEEPGAEDDGAGSATPDEDEAADLRALAAHYLATREI